MINVLYLVEQIPNDPLDSEIISKPDQELY